MTLDDLRALVTVKRQAIEAMRTAWPQLAETFADIQAEHTRRLIAAECPETRGRIKQMQELIELPHTLLSEVQQLEQSLEDLPDNGGQ